MKLFRNSILLVLSILTTSLIVSCDKDKEPFISPSISVHGLYINSDTIASTKTPVPVGDTLKIPLSFYGYMHDIEYINIIMDREYAKDSIAHTEDLLKLCNPLYTNVKEGVYYFNSGIQTISLTLLIIPQRIKEEGKNEFPIKLSLKSKCNEGDEYNPYNLEFYYAIKNKE